jgi:hypothetical protein
MASFLQIIEAGGYRQGTLKPSGNFPTFEAS